MSKSKKFAAVLTSAMALTSLLGVSAFADSRHQDETWREQRGSDRRDERRDDRRYSGRHDDRDFLSGTIERLDRRRGIAVVRSTRNGRPVIVEMTRRAQNRPGVDFSDLRRGDYVTFVGDWSRSGFTAWRIDSVDTRNGRRW
jgi:hypothetical protein